MQPPKSSASNDEIAKLWEVSYQIVILCRSFQFLRQICNVFRGHYFERVHTL